MMTLATLIKQAALTPRDQQIIKHYLLGGAMIGGAGGLTVAMLNQLRQSIQDSQPDTSLDDDTLYLKVPAPNQGGLAKKPKTTREKFAEELLRTWLPQAEKQGSMGAAVGMAGGAGAGLLTYQAVMKMFQRWKRKALQKEMDIAQHGYLSSVDQEAQALKSAAAPGTLETALAAPLSIGALWAIGTAALTNKLLDKQFGVKAPKPEGPKRVIISQADPIAQPGMDEEDEFTGMSPKMALALDLASQLVLTHHVKNATIHLSDYCMTLLGVASGQAPALRAQGMGESVELMHFKAASLLDEDRLTVASQLLLRDPILGPSNVSLLLAEAYDMVPTVLKCAHHSDPDIGEFAIQVMADSTALSILDLFPGEDPEKSAFADPMSMMAAPDLMDQLLRDEQGTESATGTDDTNPMVTSETPETDEIADVIDKLFKNPSKVVSLTGDARPVKGVSAHG